MLKNKHLWRVRAIEGAEAGGSGGGFHSEDGRVEDLEKELASLREKLDEADKARESAESEIDKWKSMSRKWEDRAKSKEDHEGSSEVEERLADLEAKLSEERDAKARAERRNLLLAVAAEEGVSSDDQQFLPDTDDEDLLRKHAKRLATRSAVETNNFGGKSGSTRESIIERAKNL